MHLEDFPNLGFRMLVQGSYDPPRLVPVHTEAVEMPKVCPWPFRISWWGRGHRFGTFPSVRVRHHGYQIRHGYVLKIRIVVYFSNRNCSRPLKSSHQGIMRFRFEAIESVYYSRKHL
jgi:hypothetical protein